MDSISPACWAEGIHIQWLGTGIPQTIGCNHLSTTYEDQIFDLATAGCDAGPIGCYKVLRQWTVLTGVQERSAAIVKSSK
ncbi:MAG: hypothetical protein IPJ43_20520 [Saprospiraceae bacterium]|nr:hypothetical protein [Saprospiraceae bacterium]